MAINDVIRLTSFQTRALLPLEVRGPGTYTVDLQIEGNSILSTLYIKALDGGATVKANYFETTTGDLFGERKDLPGHPLQNAASTNPNKITVTPFHVKPKLEVIVAGGNAEFSVYATVVDSFATDLDAALIFDGETFVADENKAVPIACYDEDSGKLFFLRCKNGALVTDPINGGDPKFYDGTAISTPAVQQDLTTFTVPVGKTAILGTIKVSSFIAGTWIADLDGAIIGSGRTSAGHPDSFLTYVPRRNISAGSTFTLKYTGRGPASDVTYHVMTTEI